MTLPAQKIQMPAMPTPTPGEKHTRLTKPETQILLTTGSPYTRVLVALVSTKYLTRFESRYLGVADLMTMCELSPSSVYAALKTLIAEGRCHQLEGRYGYIEIRGPRLSTPRPISTRGRYERKDGKGARKAKGEQTPEVQAEQEETPPDFLHNPVHNPVHNYGRAYGEFEAESAVQDSEKGLPKELRRNILNTSTTTDTDTRAEGTPAAHQVAGAFADATVVVVGSASQNSEQHPPVGGAADAAGLTTGMPVQDFHDQDFEIQKKITTDNENVPPAAAALAPRTRPETPAASAVHPVPQALNRKLWADWVSAFAVIEGAGLSDVWTRWEAHVGGNASQQLAHAEQWAKWAEAGLVESLRLQVPETIADTSVRSPARHLAGAMSNRAEEARRAPAAPTRAAAPVHDGPVVAPVAGQRRVDPATGTVWVVESVAYGQVTFEEPDAPTDLRVATVATWSVSE